MDGGAAGSGGETIASGGKWRRDHGCGWRRHGGLGRLAGGKEDGRIWPVRQRLSEVGLTQSMAGGRIGARGASGGGGRHGVRGAAGGDGGRLGTKGAARCIRWRRPAQRDEPRPVVKETTTVQGAAGGLAGGGRRCSGPTCQQSLNSGGASVHQRGLAGGEQRVKTQPGLGRANNDGSFPLLRALSGGRSRLTATGPVLAFSRTCVLALSVCG
uniref:Uncharacterized protein n=1 Tax=Oryza nivara TaxID=4536 RepID=A0A0E0HED5_ORYNI